MLMATQRLADLLEDLARGMQSKPPRIIYVSEYLGFWKEH